MNDALEALKELVAAMDDAEQLCWSYSLEVENARKKARALIEQAESQLPPNSES